MLPEKPDSLIESWRKKLRAIPFLCGGLALLGLTAWCVITWRNAYALLDPSVESLTRHYHAAMRLERRSEFVNDFFVRHWKIGALCLAPAAVLSLFIHRRKQLFPVLFWSVVFVLVYWIAADLFAYYSHLLQSRMGEVPVPGAFYAKIALQSALLLSVPLLYWLYWRATILDRYVVKSFLIPALLCLFGIIGLLITNDLISNANDFIKAGFSPGQIGMFYVKQLPQLILRILDLALLLATLFVLGRMSTRNELISMMGAGRSLVRILSPLLIIALWSCLFGLTMNYEWAPNAQNYKDEMLRNADKSAERRRREKNSTYNVMYRNRDANRTWFLGRVPNSPAGGDSIDFCAIIQDDGKGNLIKAYYGRRAAWIPNLKEWRLYGAHIVDPALIKEKNIIPAYERYSIAENFPETPWSILSNKLNPQYLSVPELASYLRANEQMAPSKLARYQTTFQSRFSLPVRPLLLVLVAGPLVVVMSRRGMLKGVVLSVLCFVVLFIGFIIMLETGNAGILPPWLAAWSVNLVFLVLGLFLLWRKNYNGSLWFLNPLSWFRRPTRT